MSRITAWLFVAVVLLVTVALAENDRRGKTVHEHTTCTNGYKAAYTITAYDLNGLIIKITGEDCNGNPISITPHYPRVILAPLAEPYDLSVSEPDGAWGKIQLATAQDSGKVWGRNWDGGYYLCTTAPLAGSPGQ